MSDPARLAYLAGALDYNNSIRMIGRRHKFVPMIHIANTDRAHIQLFAKTFGGEFRARANGLFVFQRSHMMAVEIVRKIRPYILLNAVAADNVLDWGQVPQKVVDDAPKYIKVACPKGCGNMMAPGSTMCLPCWTSVQEQRSQQSAPVKGTPTRYGTTINTPNGRIHRMR